MDGHDADDAKKSTADMTAFIVCGKWQQWMEFMFPVLGCLALADYLHYFSAGAKFASADAIQVPDNVRLHHYKEIDELEQSINDLRTEMGVEGSPSPSVPPSVKEEPKSGIDSA